MRARNRVRRDHAPASASAATAAVPGGFVGVNLDAPIFPQPQDGINASTQFAKMVATGVQAVRVAFNWAGMQPYASWSDVPSNDQTQYVDVRWGADQLHADRSVDGTCGSVRDRGPAAPLLYAPPWDARPSGGDLPIPRTDGPFAKFAAALVARYGPHGSFWQNVEPADPIRIWEIWNEPNLTYFWPEQPFAKSYVALLAAAHAVRFMPRTPTRWWWLGGCLISRGTRCLRSTRSRAAPRTFDAVAIHPYTKYPAGVITILQRNRNVMNKHGDQRKPLIANEAHVAGVVGEDGPGVNGFDIGTTAAGQAKDIKVVLPMLGNDRKSLNLLGFDWYTWATSYDSNGSIFDFSGLLKYDSSAFTTTPAYGVFKQGALALEAVPQAGTHSDRLRAAEVGDLQPHPDAVAGRRSPDGCSE